MALTLNAIEKIINMELARYNKQANQGFKEAGVEPENVFQDVKVTVEKDHVLVTYDGSGYDYLSLESDYFRDGSGPRKNINEKLKPHGLYIEDRNSWSFHVYN